MQYDGLNVIADVTIAWLSTITMKTLWDFSYKI